MSSLSCAPHDHCNPDSCFAAKIQYMKRHNVALFQYREQGGGHPVDARKKFHGQTVRERYVKAVKEAGEGGFKDVSPKSRMYTGR